MNKITTMCAMAACAGIAGMAVGESITLDLAGVNSNDNFGSPLNEFSIVELGDVTITGIGWENVVGNGDDTGVTWGNEMTMAVVDAGDLSGVYVSFFPDQGGATAGGVWGPASSGGIIDLASQGLEFNTASGSLLIEFFETYNDVDGATDAHYESGTVVIEYETASVVPGIGGLAALAGFGLVGRRRR